MKWLDKIMIMYDFDGANASSEDSKLKISTEFKFDISNEFLTKNVWKILI